MRQLEISEDTFRDLVRLKNHWSYNYRQVTNLEVAAKIDALKKEIFGYGEAASMDEIERIAKGKTRDQLEAEADRFSRALGDLLVSGYDFEPEYSMNDHVSIMLKTLEEGGNPPAL